MKSPLLLAALLLVACVTPSSVGRPTVTATVSTTQPTPTPTSPPPPGICPLGDPEAHVYHPARLQVKSPCQEAVGTVVKRRLEDDGDWHVLLWVDGPYQGLLMMVLNEEDNWQGAVALVLEIVPDCRERPASSQVAAHCPRSPVPVPALQQHIEVWG